MPATILIISHLELSLLDNLTRQLVTLSPFHREENGAPCGSITCPGSHRNEQQGPHRHIFAHGTVKHRGDNIHYGVQGPSSHLRCPWQVSQLSGWSPQF